MSDTSYTPLENPDLTTIDPATIGVDPSITTQAINAKLSPFSVDSSDILNINKEINFAGDVTVSGIIKNTDLAIKLNAKANASYVDNTFATQAAVDLKADKTTVYAKTEIDNSLGLKANLANPTFTGTVSGITKAMVGLDSVDNTSDASKPDSIGNIISTECLKRTWHRHLLTGALNNWGESDRSETMGIGSLRWCQFREPKT
jgi:hypothetical protein